MNQKSEIRWVLAGLLGCIASWATPTFAASPVAVVSSTEGEVVLEWSMPVWTWQSIETESAVYRRPTFVGGFHAENAGEPDLPSLIRMVLVPRGVTPRVHVLDVSSESMPIGDLAPVATEEFSTTEQKTVVLGRHYLPSTDFASSWSAPGWAEVASTTSVRGESMARIAIHPFRFDGGRQSLHWAKRLIIRVEWDVPSTGNRGFRSPTPSEALDPLLKSLVVNPEMAGRNNHRRPIATSRGAQDSFASAPNWLKVKLTATGIYQVDYFTFANAGFDPGQVDPHSVRVFSGRFTPLAERLDTPRDPFMLEHALLDIGDGDATFETEDRLLFYAKGPHGWAAEYDSSRSRTDHLENPYTDETVIWVTWAGNFTNPPRRMSSRSVPPDSTATSFSNVGPERIHVEENNLDNFRFRDEDGWWWESLRGRGRNRPYTFRVTGVADGTGSAKVRVGSIEPNGEDRHTMIRINGTGALSLVADSTWTHTPQSALVELTGPTAALREGLNTLYVDVERIPDVLSDQVLLAWFDIEYNRSLTAQGGRSLQFFSDPVNGVKDYLLQGFDATGNSIYLFDVTDPHATVQLTDAVITEVAAPHGIRFSESLTSSRTQWYVATTLEGVSALPDPEVATFRNLRDASNGSDYIIVYHPNFEDGALRLAELRSTLPKNPNQTLAVSIFDVYNEFSWGMTDPMAIRDFFKYAWENWTGRAPEFACLIGDASYDTKPFLSGSPENLLPTYTNRFKESTSRLSSPENIDFYSTDDFFGYLEEEDFIPLTQPGLDMAIGRYPVDNAEFLDVQLDKLEMYLKEEQPGQWQNRVILVADDEKTLDDASNEKIHTLQVEDLSQVMPPSIDKVKIYLTEYPRNDFGKKPEAQAKFIDEFTRGALMVSYTGHGDQNTMSQEEVFITQKIPELLNEQKLPIFSTFSCTVSRFDLLSGSSMCELFLFHDQGGSVTTFASGALVFSTPSSVLNLAWIGSLFGTPYLVGTHTRDVLPLAKAALVAKTLTGNNDQTRKNSEKYVLLGDPAIEVRFGESFVEFDSTTVDSLVTEGTLRVVRGSVLDDQGNLLDGSFGRPAFQGTGFVHVTENADTSGYHYLVNQSNGTTRPDSIAYSLDGPTLYRGEVPIVNGRFEAKFFVSEAVPAGNLSRVSVFALESDQGLDRHGSGAAENLKIAPTISPGQVNDTEGPEIRILFEGYEDFVEGDFIFTDRPVIVIDIEDPSGVNLRPFPQFGRFEAEVDGQGRIVLADDFAYVEGSVSKGRVRRIISLPAGEHTLEVKAFDNVGNRGSAKVRFTVVTGSTPFDLVDAAITPYPNPFQDQVGFVYRLTHDAEVTLKVFTVAGRKVFEDDSIRGLAGENVFRWSGIDDAGNVLANGTYLYKLEASFDGASGSQTQDEFVGHVVKMR